MARAVWIDAGNDDNPAQLKPLGAVPYFDIREPRLTPAYLRARNLTYGGVGVYAVASWYPEKTGEGFAQAVSDRLRALDLGGPALPMVCLDIEVDDIRGYLLPALAHWRQLRPKRVTDLTLEGHKGALFAPADVIHVAAMVRYIVPQSYNGAMTQVWDTYAMTVNLTQAGFPIAKVCPFYDAAHLPEWWGIPAGYAFTQGRLP